jgi:transcriptional regulator with XRE-family HTH domain
MAQTLSQRIAATVRDRLADEGRTQTELAKYLGITQPNITRRLNGEYSFATNELESVAAFFGIALTDLIGGRVASKTENVA